jgi:uncharacterized protein (TIGR03085 family)
LIACSCCSDDVVPAHSGVAADRRDVHELADRVDHDGAEDGLGQPESAGAMARMATRDSTAAVMPAICVRQRASQLFDAVERAQLCDLLAELGPEAPTLLDPWTTRDLAAHLVLREHDPVAGPGLVVPGGWGRFAERRRRALALRDFTGLVATIRSGPPPGFFRMGWVRRFPNLNEFFVHHEDVRRANGCGPRTNERAMDEALWRNVSRVPWFLTRRLRGAGLELQ